MALSLNVRFDQNGDLQQNAEVHFTSLFQDILNFMMCTFGVTEEAVSQALVEITNGSRNVSQLKHLCAYLYRYGSHGSGLTRSRVLEALLNCHDLAPIMNKESLKVISLGGGPGNHAVGFCRALSDWKSRSRNLDIAVIDRYMILSLCVNHIHEEYRRNTAERNIHMSFSKIDLRLRSFELHQLIKYSDIILMVEIISILDYETAARLFMYLFSKMNNEAIIIYIDTPNERLDPVWKQMFDVLYPSEEMNEQMNILYTSTVPPRFGFNGNVTSRARISVLRKRHQGVKFNLEMEERLHSNFFKWQGFQRFGRQRK